MLRVNITLKGIDLDSIKKMQEAVHAYKNNINQKLKSMANSLQMVDDAMAGQAQKYFKSELEKVNENQRKLVSKLEQFEQKLAEVAKQYKGFDSQNSFAGKIK